IDRVLVLAEQRRRALFVLHFPPLYPISYHCQPSAYHRAPVTKPWQKRAGSATPSSRRRGVVRMWECQRFFGVRPGRRAACPRSGPVEGVWGNREVSAAPYRAWRGSGGTGKIPQRPIVRGGGLGEPGGFPSALSCVERVSGNREVSPALSCVEEVWENRE